MVDVDIDVKYARVVFEEFEYGEDEVVDVAETGRLALLRVVEASGPVNRNVRLSLVQAFRALDRAARVDLAEPEDLVEDRTVLAEVELLP